MATELAPRTPRTALEKALDWHDPTQRRLRAAEAVRDGDRDALCSLVEAWMFLHGRKRGTVSSHTLASYRRGVCDLLDWLDEGHPKLHKLAHEHANLYALHLQERGGRGGTPLAPASVNARLAAARAVMKALIWTELRDADPFSGISVTDPTPIHEKRDPFSPNEMELLLSAASRRERCILLLGADTGLRISEVSGLTWGSVKLSRRRLRVVRGKGNKDRTVALTRRCAEALTAIRPTQTKQDALVIGVSRRRISAIFQALCRRAEVEHRSFHSARHTAGTQLYEATGDVMMVSRHLGLSHIDTARVYAKLSDSRYVQAVDAMEAAPGGGPTP